MFVSQLTLGSKESARARGTAQSKAPVPAEIARCGGAKWQNAVTTKGKYCLVGGDWNMTGLCFHTLGIIIIPVDELISFRGVGIPPTSRGLLGNGRQSLKYTHRRTVQQLSTINYPTVNGDYKMSKD